MPTNSETLQRTLSDIVTRLSAIERTNTTKNSSLPKDNAEIPGYGVTSRGSSNACLGDVPRRMRVSNSEDFLTTTRTPDPTADGSDAPPTITMLADAIRSLQPNRSCSYYVSNFDPHIHDIDAWCEEVDRALAANG